MPSSRESAIAVNTVKANVEGKKKAQTAGSALLSWWPVAVGLLLTGFAPDWWNMANQLGIWTVRATFPLALLASHREIGLDDQMAVMLPHWALYIQFPLEGLLMKLMLDRGKSVKSAVMQLFWIHAVSTFVLWLVSLADH